MVLFKKVTAGPNGGDLPSALRAEATPERGERVLASSRIDGRDGWLVATNWSLVEFVDGRLSLRKPWHLVDHGAWRKEAWKFVVSWTDGTPSRTYPMSQGPGQILEALHERVQASVVLGENVSVPHGGTGKVAIRRNLRTGEIFDQVLTSSVASSHDPELLERLLDARNRLRDQVGLAPVTDLDQHDD